MENISNYVKNSIYDRLSDSFKKNIAYMIEEAVAQGDWEPYNFLDNNDTEGAFESVLAILTEYGEGNFKGGSNSYDKTIKELKSKMKGAKKDQEAVKGFIIKELKNSYRLHKEYD